MKNYNKRLQKLEDKKTELTEFSDVWEWIKAGRYMDELTEDELIRYLCYERNTNDYEMGQAALDVEKMLCECSDDYTYPPHEKLTPRKPPEKVDREEIQGLIDRILFSDEYGKDDDEV